MDLVAPFPPAALMHRTANTDNDQRFAAVGVAILRALAAASRKPLSEYRDLLDFGVGAGRLARMFKGFQGRYAGADIDADNVAWIAGNLPWLQAVKLRKASAVRSPMPGTPMRRSSRLARSA